MSNWRWALVTCSIATCMIVAMGILISFAAWNAEIFLSWWSFRYITGFWILTYSVVAIYEGWKSASSLFNRGGNQS